MNFSTNATSPITLRIDKGSGAEFVPNSLVTLELVRTNESGGFFPNTVLRQGNPFEYVAGEWNFQTIGFETVPGSIVLITDPDKTTLSVQFTVTPEPLSVLGIAAGGLTLTLGRRVLRRVLPHGDDWAIGPRPHHTSAPEVRSPSRALPVSHCCFR